MNKTVITLIVLVIIGGGAYLLMKNRPVDMDMKIDSTGDEMNNDNIDGNMGENVDNSIINTDIDLGADVSMQGAVKNFTVDASNFKFSPTTMTVKQGDTVRITLKNGQGSHDLKIDGYNVQTKIITTGQEDIIEFVADKTGTFTYYCTVGSHRAMGMEGTLTVE